MVLPRARHCSLLFLRINSLIFICPHETVSVIRILLEWKLRHYTPHHISGLFFHSSFFQLSQHAVMKRNKGLGVCLSGVKVWLSHLSPRGHGPIFPTLSASFYLLNGVNTDQAVLWPGGPGLGGMQQLTRKTVLPLPALSQPES